MYRMTTSFLQGEVAALSHGRRKAPSSWKPSEGGDKSTFKKGFKNKQRPDRKPDRFSLLTKTPKEIFAGEREVQAPPNGTEKKGGSVRKKITFDPYCDPTHGKDAGQDKDYPELLFGDSNLVPVLCEEDGHGKPDVSKSIWRYGKHFGHSRVFVDGGASSDVFRRGDHLAARSPSQHNAIIGRPGIRKIRAVPSTAHGMLKFPVEGGTVTLKSSRVIPLELALGSTLNRKDEKELCALPEADLDIFAGSQLILTGVKKTSAGTLA
ncbi:hypothetical protein Tco_0696630 [Tanacetum coccineum]